MIKPSYDEVMSIKDEYDVIPVYKEVYADSRQAQAGKARCEEHHHHGDRPQDRQERGKEPFRQRDEQAPAGVCPSAGRRALQGRAHRAAERA